MVWSFVYLALRRAFELILLAFGRRTPRRSRSWSYALQPSDRALLAALSRLLPRARWSVYLMRPETLLRWHRRKVCRHWTDPAAPGPTG